MPRFLVMQTLCEGFFDGRPAERPGSAKPLRRPRVSTEKDTTDAGKDEAGDDRTSTAAVKPPRKPT